MMEELERVVPAFERKYPWARLITFYNHSSNHTVMSPDALNDRTMNLSNGDCQLYVHDTVWVNADGKEHKQAFVVDGGQKGLVDAFTEREFSAVDPDTGDKRSLKDMRILMGDRKIS